MRYLIDTNCCLYLFASQYPRLNARILATDKGDIGLSAIVFAELALGSMNGKAPPMAALELLAMQMPLLPFDATAARSYGALPFRRGRFDRLLAAHALALGLTVITRNLADFADIPGLKVEDWTQ
ncbi:type II toxin-antitoxin system VapC family toxin [Sphingobium sp. BYY-5]|uniref:type II toxin-antitoxin system VapC family toxin n=1 Tax=Sphingobium sp. BYY-5 TaxID=2926400 RepID=UPI001FA80BBF|nr:type II toxin-antitoxin system VapC family toxin [Sphingobium sp. BYY-5]MCI4588567.1 type II toxin-antitoxin system VapC family toxin [Sphingobium sp. BYY-5]